ncbi:MAG: glutamate racemase [Hyphomonadaceae bacterium]
MSDPLSLEADLDKLFGHVLVFDSGVGGLTIARELSEMASSLSIDYAADTGFFPYGDKSDDELRDRLPKVAKALFEAVQPDAFVIACNTASTLALDNVRAALPCPVIGTVPAIKPAALQSKTGTIGLLATPGTIQRAYTDKLIADFASDIDVIKHGSIALVALAEAVARGEAPEIGAFAAAQSALFDAPGGDRIDTIVLACTHFPLVRQELAQSAPRAVCYIDSGEAIARQTLRQLIKLATNKPPERDTACGYITDALDQRAELVSVFERFGFAPTRSISVPD